MKVQPLKQEDVRNADIVVVGRIANYRLVSDGNFGKHARFDILIDEVLKGPAQSRLTVAWQRSTFGEPDTMAWGTYLIALNYWQPRQERSASGAGDSSLVVLNPVCTTGFLLPATSDEAVAIKRLLSRK